VLVSDLLDGTTLADGARPKDAGAASRVLVEAFRAAALDAGLAPADPRPSHVVVMEDGALGLLGAGVARPVDRDRARLALDALDALTADEPERFAATVEGSGLLPRAEALTAHALLRELLADFLGGPATLDAGALLALADRAAEEMPDLFALATAAAPQPQDLALGRMLAQLVNVLARLEATEDWPALARAGSSAG
jgi:predicted unusual protein kinase regulating ubiquinone biosynthesis (AarF/ABC1/UbiB family)